MLSYKKKRVFGHDFKGSVEKEDKKKDFKGEGRGKGKMGE